MSTPSPSPSHAIPQGRRPRDTKVPGDFYTLDAVYAAWLARDAVVAEYMKQGRELGVTVFVSVTERKNVVGWLEGESERSNWITPLKCTYPSQWCIGTSSYGV